MIILVIPRVTTPILIGPGSRATHVVSEMTALQQLQSTCQVMTGRLMWPFADWWVAKDQPEQIRPWRRWNWVEEGREGIMRRGWVFMWH